MKIRKVFIDGIKTHNNREINLTGCDLLTAPNGSGKTGVREAVEFGLQGFIHNLGKRPADQMQISNNGGIVVDMTLDNGFNFCREIKGTTSSAKQSIAIAGKKVGVTEGKNQIEEVIGNCPVMFDLAEFTNLSDEKKREYIFQFAKSDNEKPLQLEVVKALGVAVLGDKAVELLSRDRNPKEAVDAIIQELNGDYTELLESLNFNSNDISELTRLADMYNDQLNSTRKKIRDIEATKRRLLNEKQKYQAESAGVKELKEEIAKLETQKHALTVDIQKTKNHQDNFRKLSENHKQYSEKITELKEDIGALPEKKKIATINNHIDYLNKKLEKQHENLKTAEKMLAEKNSEVNQQLLSNQANMEEIERIKKLAEEISLIFDVIILDSKTDQEQLKYAQDKVIGKLAERNDEYNAKIVKRLEEVDRLKQEIAKIQDCITAATGKIEILENEITSKKKQIPSPERVTYLNDKLEFYTTEYQKIDKQLQEEAVENDVEDLEKQLTAIGFDMLEKKELLDKKQEAKTMMKAINTQIEDEMINSDVLEALKNVISAIQSVRNDIIETFTRPLKESIDTLLQEINPEWACYFELVDDKGKDVFYFGLQRGSRRVPYDGLSGGEDKLFSAALATALMQLENPKVKVLSIEAAEVDGANLKKLLSGLSKLSAHVDNIIVATWFDNFSIPENWNKITLLDVSSN